VEICTDAEDKQDAKHDVEIKLAVLNYMSQNIFCPHFDLFIYSSHNRCLSDTSLS